MAYDLVVFGATGFTAGFVLTEIYERTKWDTGFTWAIAGRRQRSLEDIKKDISSKVSSSGLVPGIIVADTGDLSSLTEMAKQTRLVLNCVGPYRHLGEPVVKACVEAGVDYLDLCGEPEFIEEMSLKYHDQAFSKGVTILHAAAFDSVPCDLGVQEVKREMIRRGLTPCAVEVFFQVQGSNGFGIHYATYQAAVEGFGSSGKGLRDIRKQLSKIRPKPTTIGPPLARKPSVFGVMRDDRVSGRIIRYFFADPAVVRLTQSLDVLLGTGTPAVHFSAYLVIPSVQALLMLALYFLVFQFLSARPWGRRLLLQHPKLFTAGVASKEGPSAEQLAGASFTETFYATGFFSQTLASKPNAEPDVSLVYRFAGPEPGYVATPILFIHCADTMLRYRDKVKKGVLTPAVAFHDVPMLQYLVADGRLHWDRVSG
ncbi:hypothetical protein BD410DRAFT_793699 [Rickenella mellea]|uniref:Saccharopine dehydrogenase NADP binding domain-containing protein n=1 Tax=Rickenella mellea TaxID=50990 RepID=A0A4Y7PT21_9AGAM|nr:hypothetical protein BD410DRAFT_793699 [Rickenella mellea]